MNSAIDLKPNVSIIRAVRLYTFFSLTIRLPAVINSRCTCPRSIIPLRRCSRELFPIATFMSVRSFHVRGLTDTHLPFSLTANSFIGPDRRSR